MGKKQKGFRQRYGSMTQIGRSLGLSARELGAKLKDMGLREPDGKPSPTALEDGLAVYTPLKDGRAHYMWDKQRVLQHLKRMGIEKDPDAVRSLAIREAVSELLRAIQSEEFEMGGGFAYKVVMEEIFTDILPRLPLPTSIKRVRQAIHAAKARDEAKDYALLLVSSRCAESRALDEATARYLVSVQKRGFSQAQVRREVGTTSVEGWGIGQGCE